MYCREKNKKTTAMQFLNLNSQLREEKKRKVERQRSELFPKERVKPAALETKN